MVGGVLLKQQRIVCLRKKVKNGVLVGFTVVRSLGADINMVLKLLEVFSVNDVSGDAGSDMFITVNEQLAKGVLKLPR